MGKVRRVATASAAGDAAQPAEAPPSASLDHLLDTHAHPLAHAHTHAYGYDPNDTANALVLPARKRGREAGKAAGEKKKQAPPPATRAERRLSKSQERKMQKMHDDKEKKARRALLYEALERTALREDELALLMHSGALGHTLSARENLARQLREERAGIATGIAAPESKSTTLLLPAAGEHASSEMETPERASEAEADSGSEAADVTVQIRKGDPAHSSETSDAAGTEASEDEQIDTTVSRKRVRWAGDAAGATSSKKKSDGFAGVAAGQWGLDADEDDEDDDAESDDADDDDEELGSDTDDHDDDTDDDDDQQSEEDDEEDDEDDDEADGGPRIRSRNLEARRKRPARTSSSGAAAPLTSSAFAFKVQLPGMSTTSPLAAVAKDLERAGASVPAGGENAATQAEAPASIPITGRRKADPALMKLQELRARNAPVEAMVSKAAAEEEPESDDAAEATTKHQFPSVARLAALPAGATAADALRQLDAADAVNDDTSEFYSAFGQGVKRRKARDAAGREEVADEHLLRAAMWSADGKEILLQRSNLPDSAFSAYRMGNMRVKRDHRVVEARNALPVVGMESDIMEALHSNDVVIICGETGSGKTTQVPQFLYEAGYGCPPAALERISGDDATAASADAAATAGDSSEPMPRPVFRGIPGIIGVTQPRRVAATAMASRVAQELGTVVGKGGHVGYQVRYDSSTVTNSTRVKFMTDGVLLREIQSDLLLRKYSVIMIDEAHERNINTDLLIGLLSRALPLRNQLAKEEAEAARARLAAHGSVPSDTQLPLAPLKLIIMSATLRVDDFAKNPKLFPVAPPVVRVDARQFPVTVHFARRTELTDYVGEAYAKAIKIHTRLPDGGILVFLTGAEEVEDLVRRLQTRFATRGKKKKAAEPLAALTSEAPEAVVASTATQDSAPPSEQDDEPEAPVVVLPLYALLSPGAQQRVFEPIPEGHRLIVVATNVAETSLTIPGIRYVIDAGRVKRRVFDIHSGASRYEVGWISKASADQRAGRAGRTGPGHCYRLYSSAVFGEQFPKFEDPELLRMPLESVLLNMKSMGIQSIGSFPFPSPPPLRSLVAALKTLVNLGAVTIGPGTTETLTALGRLLSHIPLHPSFGKMLVLASQQSQPGDGDAPGLLDYAIALVASMAAQEPFVRPPRPKPAQGPQSKKLEENGAGDESSDEESVDGPRTDAERRLAEEALADMEEEGSKDAAAEMSSAAAEEDKFAQARNAAAAAHARFRHPLSDALTVLRAAGAFSYTLHTEGAKAAAAFCRTNYVRAKSMKEILQLRRQLHDLVYTQLALGSRGDSDDAERLASGDAAEDDAESQRKRTHELKRAFPTALPPPSTDAETALRQLVAAGFLDRIAKRAPPEQVPSLCAAAKIGVGRHWMPYLASSAAIHDTLWTHPGSAVFDADGSLLPPYVVFHEVVNGKRAYMRGLTVIDPEWVHTLAAGTPLCKYGEPLDTPVPRYDSSIDGVVAWCLPIFGERAWALPAAKVPYPMDSPDANDTVLRTFARSLLEGHVAPLLGHFTQALLAPPSVITKALPHKRILALLDALQHPPRARRAPSHEDGVVRFVTGPVLSAAQLGIIWLQYPQYLLTEIRAWLATTHQSKLDELWQNIVQASLAGWLKAGLLPRPE